MNRLEEKLKTYARSDAYPFHMPGHKRRMGESSGPLSAAASYDITEISGFDNLHSPEGIIFEEMERASNLFGTQKTYFSVNGSTGAILAAISAAVPKGGTLLIERGCHISVYHAAYLRDLKLIYLDDWDAEADIREEPSSYSKAGTRQKADIETTSAIEAARQKTGMETTSAIEAALAFDAVVITSPSYEGEVKDVRAVAELAHRKGAILIVDEAHGAHFSFHPAFPVSAVTLGADLVVQSLHKTLPSLTQTALLHNVSGRVSDSRIQHFLDIYETSSPSYLLMASITRCIHELEDRGAGYFDEYAERLLSLREALGKDLHHLQLIGGTGRGCPETDRRKKTTARDPGKLLISVPRPWTGSELMAELRERYHLEAEMSGLDYCLLMTSVADTDEGFERLKRALFEIDAGMDPDISSNYAMGKESSLETGTDNMNLGNTDSEEAVCRKPVQALPETVISLGTACDLDGEIISLEKAEGRISGEYTILYPPDAPLIIPGERFSREMIERILYLLRIGMNITGVFGEARCGIQVRVLKDEEAESIMRK